MRELHNLTRIEPLDDLRLRASWSDGYTAVIDLSGVVARSRSLAGLRDPEIFRRARIIDRGAAIGWPGDLDYAADALRLVAEEQAEMTPAEIEGFLEKTEISQAELAEILDTTDRTVRNYLAGKTRIPRTVQGYIRAMDKEPTLLAANYRPLPKRGRPRKHTQ